MTAVVRRTAPRALALVAYVAAAAVGVVVSVRLAGGQHVFPLDDAYIHLSIARTLAEHGTYGLQPGAFATPASSLAWPLLLAGASRLGLPLEGGALVLSLLAGGAALLVVDEVFLRHSRYAARPTARGLWLAAGTGAACASPAQLKSRRQDSSCAIVSTIIGLNWAARRVASADRFSIGPKMRFKVSWPSTCMTASTIRPDRGSTTTSNPGSVMSVSTARSLIT